MTEHRSGRTVRRAASAAAASAAGAIGIAALAFAAAGTALAQGVPAGAGAAGVPAGTQPGTAIAVPASGATLPPGPVITEPPAVPEVRPSHGADTALEAPVHGRRLDAFHIGADRITFFSSRYILDADGHVDVKLGDGTRVQGQTMSLDLRLSRFTIAGDVVVTAGDRTIHGAAFSEYFDYDRAYFVPVLSKPDRWTFVAGDYAHPALGRRMPGDAFFLPTLVGDRVFLYAKSATVDPRESVRFAPARVNFGLAFVPFPSYYLNFSPNPNFAQNSLPGAYVDGPLDFAGGEHALSTVHVRYDSLDKVFPAIEQHLVSRNSYVVASVNPLTRPVKQYNVLAYSRISPGLQVQVALQESAFQHDFARPLSATAFAQFQVTGSLPHSFLQFVYDQYYDSLLAPPAPVQIGGQTLSFYGDPSHNFIPDHPSNLQLSWVGYREKIPKLPLTYQLRSDIGSAHNSFTPLQTLGGVNYPTAYYKGVGVNVATQSILVRRDRQARHRDVYFTGTFDKQRQYFSAPHHVDTTTLSASLTQFVVPDRVAVLVTYQNQNTGDFYGAQQPIAYASTGAINPFTGVVYTGFNSFRGFSTTRSLVESVVYTPSQALTLNASMRENHDFPQPIPGPPVQVGDLLGFANSGLTPYQATLDVRVRINSILVVDLARSYLFNFGGYERFSPQFAIQLQR